jgi:hypothetical protein
MDIIAQLVSSNTKGYESSHQRKFAKPADETRFKRDVYLKKVREENIELSASCNQHPLHKPKASQRDQTSSTNRTKMLDSNNPIDKDSNMVLTVKENPDSPKPNDRSGHNAKTNMLRSLPKRTSKPTLIKVAPNP